MRVALVTAPTNGAGLERDALIYRALIEGAGHECVAVDHKGNPPEGPFDLAIFDEVFVPAFVDLAPVRWLTPHPEWWFEEWTPHIGVFDRVLCKTRDAQRAFGRIGAHTIYTGSKSLDRLDSSVPRERRFLHIAGQSPAKGTAAILEAWKTHKLPYPLTVVGTIPGLKAPSKMVKIVSRLPEAALIALQNSCLFALQPSSYEGFGHVLHEPLSCGALLATTDAAPMNELEGATALIPPTSFGEQRLGRLSHVDADGVRTAVEAMWAMDEPAIHAARTLARNAYVRNAAEFEQTFLELLGTVAAAVRRVIPTGPRLAIVYPTHEAGAALVLRSVLALRHQTAPAGSFEVVIASDGAPIAAFAPALDAAKSTTLPGRAFACRVVESARPRGNVPHRNHARNAGWRAAKAPLCWMIDCDFILPPHAVEHLLAEHDAAVARGKPAVFSPCLAGVGAIGIPTWDEKTAPWMESGTLADFNAALDCGGVSPIYSGFPELYVGPAKPASVPLLDLPEGMPVVWRTLLDALGGFDEAFGEWGGDKEELVDRLKGAASVGLFEIRLLTSVQALHQPHDPDPSADTSPAKARQQEREKRARGILANEPWWATQLSHARDAMPSIFAASKPDEIPPVLLAAVLHFIQVGKPGRGPCVVVGRWADQVAKALGGEAVTLAALAARPAKSVGRLVVLDMLASQSDPDLVVTGAHLGRVCTGGTFVGVERTKLGSKGVSGLRAPLDYQRVIRGLTVAGQRFTLGGVYTIFAGRLVG